MGGVCKLRERENENSLLYSQILIQNGDSPNSKCKLSCISRVYWRPSASSVELLIASFQSESRSLIGWHSGPRGHCHRRQIRNTCSD